MRCKLHDALRSLAESQTSSMAAMEALDEFQAACRRYDWEEVERLRERSVGAYEASLDHFAASHRRMEVE